MSFTFKLRKAPTTICSLTLVGATLAPSTPVFAETQQPQTTDSQGQPAVIAQEDLSTLNQVEGNATPQTVSPQKRFIDVPESSAFYNEITWLLTLGSLPLRTPLKPRSLPLKKPAQLPIGVCSFSAAMAILMSIL